MENQLILSLVSEHGTQDLSFSVSALWNGGWASRDVAAVQRHVDELAQMGVSAPTRVPIYFPLSTNLASTTDHVQVLGPQTSGEVEYALLVGPDNSVYVTVGSDHSDRSFERFGIQLSKQLYPDVLAGEVWSYAEVQPHWDALVLRAWAIDRERRSLYQEAPLAELLSAADWLQRLEQAAPRVVRPGLVFLSGTPPTLGGLVFGDAFEIALHDPVLGRTIHHRYTIEILGSGCQ
jgi:Protein of unknown function (DUF2848)